MEHPSSSFYSWTLVGTAKLGQKKTPPFVSGQNYKVLQMAKS